MMKRLMLTVIAAALWTVGSHAQMIAANVDGVWLAAMSPNLGAELVVGERSTLGMHALLALKPFVPYNQNTVITSQVVRCIESLLV